MPTIRTFQVRPVAARHSWRRSAMPNTQGSPTERPLAVPGRCVAPEATAGRGGYSRRFRTSHRFKEPGRYGLPLDYCYYCGGRKP